MSIGLFYIVEPPRYSAFSTALLASIRKYIGPEVKVFGYCPEHRMAEIPQAVTNLHHSLGAEIRPLRTEDRWDQPYPHGNKMLAALDDRGTDQSVFLDTDIYFTAPVSIDAYSSPNEIICSPAASMSWGGEEEWAKIYSAFGLPLPQERMELLRRRGKHKYLPYFSSGLIGFPEYTPDGRRFAEIWYETARTIDRIPDLAKKRPYLDQMSLPIAMRQSGLPWRNLAENLHFILGGKLRGRPLPDLDIRAVHYRIIPVLAEVGLVPGMLALLQEMRPDIPPHAYGLPEEWLQAGGLIPAPS